MTTLTITIPKPIWLSSNQRLHWAEKARRTSTLRGMGYVAARSHDPIRDTVHVAAFIGYPRNGRADPANAAPTVKALVDGLVDAGLLADDDSTHVLGPTYLRDPSTGTPGTYSVRLVLTSQDIPWEK